MTVMTQHVPNYRNRVSLWIKYSLFGFNTVLWVIGSAIVGVGIWCVVEKATTNVYEVTNIQVDPAVAFLLIGTALFIISFAGCIGALRENTILLSIYVIIIILIFILEIGLFILALVYWNSVYGYVKANLQSMIVRYRDDADLQSVIDWLQEYWLQCCGVDRPDDWDSNIYFNCSSVGREACGVPHSCCVPQKNESLKNLQCGYDSRKESDSKAIYQTGCLRNFELWLGVTQVPLSIAGASILVIQMLTLSLGMMLHKDIKAMLHQWEYSPPYQAQQQALV